MARIVRRIPKILILLEDIILQILFLLNIVSIRRPMLENSRIRLERMIRYKMADKIPDRVKYMTSLVGLSDADCFGKLRMNRNTFSRLCYLLQHRGGLSDSRYVSVSEKVVLFLTVLAHHIKFCCVKFDFKRSGQTVSKHFHSVLNAILGLHTVLLAKPQPINETNTHPRWKWFQGCLGALDGSYVLVTVPEVDKPRYRIRKGSVAVNIAACNSDLQFIYMLAGWEGSAADSHVLRDAVSRPNGFRVPQGNYYLCDNGYTNGEGFLMPYKSVRYHLDDWGVGPSLPHNYQEFFNMNHSRARNVIERAFGVMKKRWPVLRSATFYPIKIQNRIIMACGLLHNFMRTFQPVDPFMDALADVPVDHQDYEADDYIDMVESTQAWTTFRDDLAQSMYTEWQQSRH